MSEQLLLNFDRLVVETDEAETTREPEPKVDPSKLPGAVLNAHGLWISDLDIPF